MGIVVTRAGAKDTAERDAFDRLTAIACAAFDAPHAMITVLDEDRAVFRAGVGLDDVSVPRLESVSHHLATLGPEAVFVIEDTHASADYRRHPLVTGEPCIRFFAGATVCDRSGAAVGAIGVMDVKPRPAPTEAQLRLLRQLAGLAGDLLEHAEAVRQEAARLETLRLAEDMVGVGRWRYEVASGAVTWSDEIYRVHGVAPGAFAPSLDDVFGHYHAEDRVEIQGLVTRALETGEGYSFKLRLLGKDGVERVVAAEGAAEKDATGRVIALFGVLQDVTERERLLRAAQTNERRYRLLAENTGDVITRVKMDGSSKYISPAIQQLLGWTYEDMSGQSTDYVHPEDRLQVLQAISAAVKTGQPTRLEHRAVHRQGHTVWVESAFKALTDEHGQVDDVVVVIRDMTQRKLLEDEVIEAKERAEKAAQAKSEFLANMSHELRTPLTSVIGFSGLLQASEALPAEERVYVERIATASEALLGVINDILDYSKLEANAIEMDPEPFQVAALVDGAAAIVEGQCVAKGLSLKVVADAAMPEVLTGDAGRLRQVMLNFLSNAVKFTGKGGVTLRVGGRPEGDGRWRLRVAVTDTGIGIPAEKIEQLFERFTQADASTTRVYGGTGLGLAISRRLIEIMGGEIGVDSRPGEGATFWFETPLAQGGVLGRLANDAGDLAAPGGMAGGRILMADDAPGNRELVSAILRGLGLEIDTVCDGAEAVQAMQTGAYDLVLMDVHMPVMDGLTATREIRRMQAGSGHRTPILALTANVQADQVARCLDCGMDGHLAKPIQIPELAGALAHWLAGGDPAALAG
ncbi:PAS domain S-box-containing protein [Brevundimonas bullata]|uniref:histidine kinase n=1 Tax=Brevundimonas bullata TaxID=13160 RepID=A0A7W7IQS2_9CAUL|nr:ATP-binding protein [Brevundimonas bullata]MBB4798522.1 PAS domain S-box-containing protein [Brevundimonas bullata]MBB6383163.1 PAS domain S-box-containing protein [Brevundimonas bullata]